MTNIYEQWLNQIRINVLEERIEEHKRALADHLSCIDKLTEELNALRWGKENDEQEDKARSV